MRMALGWVCYQIVMRWPVAWPSCHNNIFFAWCVSWAGYYAYSPPKGEVK